MFKLNKKPKSIKETSNVIQYDDMGYPLRLVIDYKGRQVWIDTIECVGDVVVKWEGVK